MLSKEQKTEIIAKFGAEFGSSATDAGCAATQVALLTARINGLSGHFAKHKKDFHSNTGLLTMIGRRKRLLRYVAKNSEEQYKKLIKELGLRK